MIHTILPMEALLPAPEPVQSELRRCPYGWVQAVQMPQGVWQVSRVISTDPAAYLDPHFSPGASL